MSSNATLPALIDELMAIAPAKQTHRYDFEKPTTQGGPVFPLRAMRDLIEAFAAELDRPEGADTRLWLTPQGVQLCLPRQHLIAILRRKTVINLDGTPAPALRSLFPDLEEIHLPVPNALHVTQITDTLATRDSLSGEQNALRDRIAAAVEAVTKDAAAPVIFGHKPLLAESNDSPPRLAVSNPNAQYGWFDNQNRGLNCFSETDCLVIIGRYSWPIAELRAQVQAVRWSATPAAATTQGQRLLPYHYRAEDGTGLARWTQSDPDPDVDAMVRWSEASTILQTIGRGRAALRQDDAPLRVYLFTNLPIPELPINRMATLAELGAPLSRRGSNVAFTGAQERCQERNTDIATETERLVAKAIVTLSSRGEAITFSAVAGESGISRNTLYTRPILRAMVEQPPGRAEAITRPVTPGSPHRYIRSDPGVTAKVIELGASLPAARTGLLHPAPAARDPILSRAPSLPDPSPIAQMAAGD